MSPNKPIGKLTQPDQKIIKARRQRLTKKRIEAFKTSVGGVFARTCPVCDYEGNFVAFGNPPRYDAQCPSCRSLERHRLFWLYLQRSNALNATQTVLHFAPERLLEPLIRDAVGTYETSDLFAKRDVTHRVNIEETGLPDAAYDVIICNHVLEHVNDEKALAEFFRMLKPGGFALLSTPVCEGWNTTYENADVSENKDRLLHFGQRDHARFFGRDIRDRIRAPGFELENITAIEPDVHRFGLMRGETLFVATKPTAKPLTKAKKPPKRAKSN
ncbi:MAG: methyltransferase domain-containing protein [Sulfitobacter sp.]